MTDHAVVTDGDGAGPTVVGAARLERPVQGAPRMRSRWIRPPREEGWDGFVLSEWELVACGWSDLHPHDEVNFVIEGELHVAVDGVTVVATKGDTVTVPGGSTGSYWAPRYARMVGIYGRNPDGEASTYLDYWEFPAAGVGAGSTTDRDEHGGTPTPTGGTPHVTTDARSKSSPQSSPQTSTEGSAS